MTQKEFKAATNETFRAWVYSLRYTPDSFSKLMSLAIQAFSEWKAARASAHDHGRVNTELRATNTRLKERYRKAKAERDTLKVQVPQTSKQQANFRAEYDKLIRHNAQLFNDLDDMRAKYYGACEANKGFVIANEELEADVKDIYSELERVRIENQRLVQLLSTHLVPVPGNPGLAFISHPN